jgi:hypothetical protein
MVTIATEVSFDSLTPIEQLSIADRERIHTQTLRWFLGADSPFELDARQRLLYDLCPGLQPGIELCDARTEVERLDLVIDVCEAAQAVTIVVENKLKSAEGARQLERYNEAAAKLGSTKKYFLTLIGEPASDSSWTSITYAEVRNAVLSILNNEPHSEFTPYIRWYASATARLARAAQLVVDSPEPFARIVFGGRATGTEQQAFARYVERMRLSTVFQRAWMRKLGLALGQVADLPTGAHWDVGETHQSGLITVRLRRSRLDGVDIDSGIQVQAGSIKMYAAPAGYQRGASEQTHKAVCSRLEEMAAILEYPSGKFTKSRDRGFRSFQPGVTVPQTYEFLPWVLPLSELVTRLAPAPPSSVGA